MFNIQAKFEFLDQVNGKWGNLDIISFIKELKRDDILNMPQWWTINHYSTRTVVELIDVTRPWPKIPDAPVQRVSTWMTTTRDHIVSSICSICQIHAHSNHRTNMEHRRAYDSPPTSFFVRALLSLMKHCARWHLKLPLEHWAFSFEGMPDALLTVLKYDVQRISKEEPDFSDEALGDPGRGNQKWTADEIFKNILVHTRHERTVNDFQMRALLHKRKSRHATPGLTPTLLRAPELGDNQIFSELQTPAYDIAHELGVIEIHPELRADNNEIRVLDDVVVICFGAEMCYHCRHDVCHEYPQGDPRATGRGIDCACIQFHGRRCQHCIDGAKRCLFHKEGYCQISLKDWDVIKPKRGTDLNYESKRWLLNFAWFADGDNGGPEDWDEIDDRLDVNVWVLE
ncbi:hypothetical protein DACRYDRAFT_95352 [Dacryopinax primogenitus]|uniref:Putative Zn2Cys6 domain-containing protein n=1 Tax=Dacryopinax primogenitus (strain DJM 731) TaxID=1858805 RepID=M5FU32_DACPD|nr:uncharacterized protein DACRYDRAFT_95352 [Dacryopinax primogenitus]EJU01181.1 hypothetical protein DACRYDRAFT_95352 [Dacryopinax primogenitus]